MVEYSVLVNALPITSTTVTYGGLYVLSSQSHPRSSATAVTTRRQA